MFITQILLVLFVCLIFPLTQAIQLRLVNSNNNKDKDNSYASTYGNYEPESYNYNYGVADHNTGDHKTQWETKENGVVHGSYSVLEPDGSTRVVEYTADTTGFHPVVKKIDNTPIAASTNYDTAYAISTPRPVYSISTPRPNYAISTPTPTYAISTPAPIYAFSTARPTLDVYRPSSLLYSNQYNPMQYPGYYNNDYNNRRLYYPSNTYTTPTLNSGYNNRYYNRGALTGYDGIYRGYNNDMNILGPAPYNLPLRTEKQPVPLLHSTYHGYDNLYH